jgi:hypothetical protein
MDGVGKTSNNPRDSVAGVGGGDSDDGDEVTIKTVYL